MHKKTFQCLGRSNYQCPQCASVCQVRNILFEDQTKSFFLSPGQGVYNFEETPKSIQDAVGDVYCPGKYCSNREKFESLDGYVATTRSIYSSGSLVVCSQISFYVTGACKDDKNRQNTFFSLKKR